MKKKEQDKKQPRLPLGELIREAGGDSALHRTSGVSRITVRRIRQGEQRPYLDTAERIAAGLGVEVDDIAWPMGFVPVVHPASRRFDLSDLYSDGELKGEIQELIEAEVQRRVEAASVTAAQTQDVESK